MKLELRLAVLEDLELIYNWINDPVVRANSFSTKSISMEEHTGWYLNMLQRDDVFLYIMSDNGTDIGQVRIKKEADMAEISYSIDAAYRGRGYGNKMIELLVQTVKSDFPEVKRLTAEVKPENISSGRVFKSNGFEEKYVVYELTL